MTKLLLHGFNGEEQCAPSAWQTVEQACMDIVWYFISVTVIVLLAL